MAIQAEECNWMRLPYRVYCILLFEYLLCDLCNIPCVIKRYLCFQAKIKCPEIKVIACSNRSTELLHSKIDYILLLLGIVQSSSNVLIMYFLHQWWSQPALALKRPFMDSMNSLLELKLSFFKIEIWDLADLAIHISTIMALICSIKWWFWKTNRPLASIETGLWNPMKNHSVTFGKFNRDA